MRVSVHLGGVGLMDAMDGERNAALMRAVKAQGAITTVDVFAGSSGRSAGCRCRTPLHRLLHALD